MAHRSSYEQFMDEAKSRVEQAENQSCFFVMYLDIAGFQLVNDFYGVVEGDRFLESLEKFLSGLQEVCLCSRVFSDHYLCLVKTEQEDHPEEVSESLIRNLRKFRDEERIHHKSCNLHLIGGLCRVTAGSSGVMPAIDNANIARKKAKDGMHTSLIWFNDAMQQTVAREKLLEVDIEDALTGGEFTFYLQPKVNVRSGKIVGAEALARWVRADGEMVSPEIFIPVMEQNETIFKLDFLIYDKVCQYQKELLDRGIKPIPISVNMSRLHTRRTDTAEQIHDLVCRYQIPPYLLEFELTESVLMQDFTVAKMIMSKLRSYGYKTSIDDYGSGYSGIMTFQELDFDVLKLDRSFLDETDGKTARSDIIVRQIVMLASDFQASVLCEGVETARQCERMRDLGCQVLQGYYFSGPLPADEFLRFYEERNGYCELPWIVEQELVAFAPEHINIEQLPVSQVRSISQSFFRIMPCGIAGFDDYNMILFATPEYYAMTGYSREELMKHSGEELARFLNMELLCFYDRSRLMEQLDQNKSVHLEYSIIRKDGKKIVISAYAGRASSPEWGSYILCAFFDETERKNNENRVNEYRDQAAREKERADLRLRTAVELAGINISEYDFETNMIYIPQQGLELSREIAGVKEISRDEFLAKNMVREDYKEAYLEMFDQMQTQDEVYLEFPYLIGPEAYHWVALQATVAVRENGKPIRSIAVLRLIENPSGTKKRGGEADQAESKTWKGLKNPNGPENQNRAKNLRKENRDEQNGGSMKTVKGDKRRFGRMIVLPALALFVFNILIDIGFIRFRRILEEEFIAFSMDQEMEKHLSVIMDNTILISVILIMFCLGLAVVVFVGYGFFRKRLTLENERYAMLAEFSDTILFQYFYNSDTLVLTPNARDRFVVTTLRKSDYLKEDKSVLGLSAGDWRLVKEAFEHPSGPEEMRTIRIRIKNREGAYLWCSLQMRYLYQDNKVVAAVGKVTDINSQKKLEERLVKQAETDGLTRVYNKTAAGEKIANQIEKQIEKGSSGVLFMMDMDDFKKINDDFGHVKGDDALSQLGELLTEIFLPGDIIGRIGGDEFAVYMNRDEIHEPPKIYAQRVLNGLKKLSDQTGIEITLSIGMASCPQDGNSYEEVYEAADRAMYQAKKLGKNRYYQN